VVCILTAKSLTLNKLSKKAVSELTLGMPILKQSLRKILGTPGMYDRSTTAFERLFCFAQKLRDLSLKPAAAEHGR
jgi:hypothetical protein